MFDYNSNLTITMYYIHWKLIIEYQLTIFSSIEWGNNSNESIYTISTGLNWMGWFWLICKFQVIQSNNSMHWRVIILRVIRWPGHKLACTSYWNILTYWTCLWGIIGLRIEIIYLRQVLKMCEMLLRGYVLVWTHLCGFIARNVIDEINWLALSDSGYLGIYLSMWSSQEVYIGRV